MCNHNLKSLKLRDLIDWDHSWGGGGEVELLISLSFCVLVARATLANQTELRPSAEC